MSKGDVGSGDFDPILDKIGFSVGDVSPKDNSVREISEALDCMRLWFAIRTDDGRRRALECLSRIVDDEQP
ncbi:hypothetical protein FF100_13025 [Methylobacterium terricola]|uniref:Uncharacterized protein n=1 Tax=Methylobacterium terricola TaxID=2583531 RepID=A0A5C4LI59_9HYPH|nr:hypothetical protein [Methylobacterium terricola]TNC13684.1 hypothetical protein FF100_13025 [Methylobacterium terricola]